MNTTPASAADRLDAAAKLCGWHVQPGRNYRTYSRGQLVIDVDLGPRGGALSAGLKFEGKPSSVAIASVEKSVASWIRRHGVQDGGAA